MLLAALLTAALLCTAAQTPGCPEQCYCDVSGFVSCSSVNLTHVPPLLPLNTTRLDLGYNQLQDIPYGSVTYLSELLQLSLGNNLLYQEGFTEDSIRGLTKLSYFTAGYNQLTDIPMFLPSVMDILRLSGNHIQNIPDLGIYPVLTELQLNDNSVLEITAKSFANTKQLIYLELSGNQIQRIESGAFASLQFLRILFLHDNKLTSDSLEHDEFWGLWSLTNLTLTGNPISKIPRLPSGIVNLELSQTKITHLQTSDLQDLKQLQMLTLSFNQMINIEPGTFRNLASLWSLDIKSTRLVPGVLSADLLEGLTNLTSIVMDNASITAIQPDAFKHTPQLYRVSAFNNKLSTLDQGVFSVFANSTLYSQMYLSLNPWWCDCKLRWLKEHTTATPQQKPQVISDTTMVCAGPEAVRARTFRELSPGQFICP